MKKEYTEGPKARENFERTMGALFPASKPKIKKQPKKQGKD
jgi:hypothetical protein